MSLYTCILGSCLKVNVQIENIFSGFLKFETCFGYAWYPDIFGERAEWHKQ